MMVTVGLWEQMNVRISCWLCWLCWKEQVKLKLVPLVKPCRTATLLDFVDSPQSSRISTGFLSILAKNVSSSWCCEAGWYMNWNAKCPALFSSNFSGSMPSPDKSVPQSSKWFSRNFKRFFGAIPCAFRSLAFAFCWIRSSVGKWCCTHGPHGACLMPWLCGSCDTDSLVRWLQESGVSCLVVVLVPCTFEGPKEEFPFITSDAPGITSTEWHARRSCLAICAVACALFRDCPSVFQSITCALVGHLQEWLDTGMWVLKETKHALDGTTASGSILIPKWQSRWKCLVIRLLWDVWWISTFCQNVPNAPRTIHIADDSSAASMRAATSEHAALNFSGGTCFPRRGAVIHPNAYWPRRMHFTAWLLFCRRARGSMWSTKYPICCMCLLITCESSTTSATGWFLNTGLSTWRGHLAFWQYGLRPCLPRLRLLAHAVQLWVGIALWQVVADLGGSARRHGLQMELVPGHG